MELIHEIWRSELASLHLKYGTSLYLCTLSAKSGTVVGFSFWRFHSVWT